MGYVRFKDATEWDLTINNLLDGDARSQALAREELWLQVTALVKPMPLPIGPLNEDSDARADIIVKTLAKIEANNFAHIREWRARQQRGRNSARFLGFIKMVSKRVALDYARSHQLQIETRRGHPFVWAQEDLRADPLLLVESVRTQLRFFDSAGELELCVHLERFAAALPTGDVAPDPDPPCPRVSRHVIRRAK